MTSDELLEKSLDLIGEGEITDGVSLLSSISDRSSASLLLAKLFLNINPPANFDVVQGVMSLTMAARKGNMEAIALLLLILAPENQGQGTSTSIDLKDFEVHEFLTKLQAYNGKNSLCYLVLGVIFLIGLYENDKDISRASVLFATALKNDVNQEDLIGSIITHNFSLEMSFDPFFSNFLKKKYFWLDSDEKSVLINRMKQNGGDSKVLLSSFRIPESMRNDRQFWQHYMDYILLFAYSNLYLFLVTKLLIDN